MKYKLKKDFYLDIKTFAVNTLEPRSYFIPFASEKEARGCDELEERENSSLVQLLSGEWDFAYYPKRSLIPQEFESDAVIFDTVSVPSTWQRTGYEPPCYLNSRYQFKMKPPKIPADIPTGVYRKKFSAKKGESKILTFLGAASNVEVYLNGAFIGYGEGSHNSNEFLLKELNEENELIVLVSKWCVGSYLECQDMFRENGIFRDVYLTAVGENGLFDIGAETFPEKEGEGYRLKISATQMGDVLGKVRFLLEDAEGQKLIFEDLDSGEKEFRNIKVKEWTAETPYLYTGYWLLFDRQDNIICCARQNIGFKHTQIVGEVFYFNGKPVKLVGVNHHDSDREKGYVMSASDYLRDAQLMKEYHCNTVRMSHYPPDPLFLTICDRVGLYVIDEADIECHGVYSNPLNQRFKRISHRLMWKERFLARVAAMYQRDKNHAAITMWSLGNEAGGYRCQDACYEYLKTRSRLPVHYEGVIHTKRFAYDVISEMYTHTPKVEAIAAGKLKDYKGKPFFLCEYAHAMGVGPGELKRYVDLFYNNSNLMGGCIWEFCDHAVYHRDGKYEYTYGGDHGEKKHDGNFCVDGLFFPDRTPSTGALEMRECYKPILCRYENGQVRIENRYSFLSSKRIETSWHLFEKGKQIAEGALQHDVEPMQSKTVPLSLPNVSGDDVYILFQHKDAVSGGYAGADETILVAPQLADAPKDGNSKIVTDKDNIELSLGDFTLTAEKKSGALTLKKANEIVFESSRGLRPEIYRAVIDNDRFIRIAWKLLGIESAKAKLLSVKAVQNEGENKIVYRYALRRLLNIATCKIELSFAGEQVKAEVCFKKGVGALLYNDFTRLGVTMCLNRTMEKVCYFGRGDRENLPDFKEHAPLGIYCKNREDMSEKYIKPQEGGTRCDVRWTKLTDCEGNGISVEAIEKPYCLSVCDDSTNNLLAAAHREDLKEENAVFVHIDAAVRGAGTQSCGQAPLEYARVNLKTPVTYRFFIRPIRGGKQEKK